MFSCEYYKMFTDTYFEEQLPMAALASHTRDLKVPAKGPTLGSHPRIPPYDLTLGSHNKVPLEGPGMRFKVSREKSHSNGITLKVKLRVHKS